MARDPAVHRANNATSYKQSSADAAAPGSLPRLVLSDSGGQLGNFFNQQTAGSVQMSCGAAIRTQVVTWCLTQ